jgi:hypothetical protein
VFDVILTGPGTNLADVIKAVLTVRPDLTAPEASKLVERAPVPVLEQVWNRAEAAVAADRLTAGGGKVETHIVSVGPDIARGWGLARSVAADFLYDQPVMLGSQRIGPDLANVGARLPDANWHYRHLFDPKSVDPKSVMPPYRFLFEQRPASIASSEETAKPFAADMTAFSGSQTNFADGETLNLTGELALDTGSRIVPGEDARALVAYLLSLKVSTPLLERPVTAPASAMPATTTNATSAASTNTTAL